jgi:hypothetical protein
MIFFSHMMQIAPLDEFTIELDHMQVGGLSVKKLHLTRGYKEDLYRR